MNPLYEQMKGQQNGIVQKFMQFKQNFKGDPRQEFQRFITKIESM